MLKQKTITLLESKYQPDRYVVDQLVNTIKPTIGSILRSVEVSSLIQQRDTKVIVKRAKT
jgi:hypothetical protein